MKTVVLLSGGVDSTVLMAVRHKAGDDITAVTFDYGQSHRREIRAASAVAEHYQARHYILGLRDVLHGSALTGQGVIPEGHADSPDATFVPGRNLIFLSIAAGLADEIGASAVLFGANADDFGGYPDCRPKFLTAMDEAVSTGTRNGVSVSAPLMSMTKRQVIDCGHELNAPLELTWSCYRGGDVACGNCGACVSRIDSEWERELA